MEVKYTGRRIMLPKDTQNSPPRSSQQGNVVIYVVMIRLSHFLAILIIATFDFGCLTSLGETGRRREV